MELNIGNMLTVISIVIALVSLSFANNRKVWWYKFSASDFWLYGIIFIFVNYLLFFQKMLQWGIYIPSLVCDDNKGLPASSYAYFLTLAAIAHFVYKVLKGGFPQSNFQKLINYYNTLIEDNPSFLINYIKEYHLSELHKHIAKVNKAIDEDKKKDYFAFDEEAAQNAKPKPNLMAMLLSEVIFNQHFIEQSIIKEPLFFLRAVHPIKFSNYCGSEEAVNYYFRLLIRTANPMLVTGLQKSNNFLESDPLHIAYRLTDSECVRLMVENLDFAQRLQLLDIFGNEALRDVENNPAFYELPVSEWEDETYQTHPATLYIRLLDICLRQILYVKCKDSENTDAFNFYPYYWEILKKLIKKYKLHAFQNRSESYADKLYRDYIDVFDSLLQACVLRNCPNYMLTIIQNVYATIIENSVETSADVAERLFLVYFSTKETEARYKLSNTASEQLYYEIRQSIRIYKNTMVYVWGKVDAVKYSSYPHFKDFEKVVLSVRPNTTAAELAREFEKEINTPHAEAHIVEVAKK